jgi:hypothetical protein
LVIELFVRSRRIVVDRDAETLGHACAGAGAQMHAAASTRSMTTFPEAEREALDRVQVLADALHEDLLVWNLATRRGRKEAQRRGIRVTPRVVFRSGGPESVEAFQARAGDLLHRPKVPAS